VQLIAKIETMQEVELPLGLVVHDMTGHPWVYLGYRLNKSGSREHRFHATLPLTKGYWPAIEIRAVKRGTLIKQFADLARHWPA